METPKTTNQTNKQTNDQKKKKRNLMIRGLGLKFYKRTLNLDVSKRFSYLQLNLNSSKSVIHMEGLTYICLMCLMEKFL